MAQHCPSCEVLFINGVKCHEQGCPDAWQDQVYECNWCGHEFKPETKHQTCCSDDCESAWNGQ